MDKIICGIDPGSRGGIAVIDGSKAYAYQMPMSGKEINIYTVMELLRDHHVELVVCEKVHSMPMYDKKTGKKVQGEASTWTFAEGFGLIKGGVIGAGYSLELVTPQRWKGVVLSGTAKDKEAAIDYCGQRYPTVSLIPPRCRTPKDGMADALCIAHYGLLMERGKLVK